MVSVCATWGALVLPQCRALKAPQEHLVVGVVSRVPGIHILDQTTAHPKDVDCPGTHLLAETEHDPRPDIPRPRELARE